MQKIPISSITISNRVRKDLGNLEELSSSIETIGLLSPIIINEENKLLAGERRLEACKLLGWKTIDCIVKSTSDAEQDITVELTENIQRKDFTREELINVGIEFERIESVKAEERMLSGGKVDPEENLPQGENKRAPQTRDIVAKKIGMSGKQYEREKLIVQNKDLLTPGDFADWNNREKSTNAIYNIIKQLIQPTKELTTAPKATETKEIVKEVVKEIVPEDYDHLKSQVSSLSKQLKDKEEEVNILLDEIDNANNEAPNFSANDINQKYEDLQTLYNKEVTDYQSQISTLRIELDNLRRTTNPVISDYKDGDAIYEFCNECNKFVTKIVTLQYSDAFRKISADRTLPLDSLSDSCAKVMDALQELIKHTKTDSFVDSSYSDTVNTNIVDSYAIY